MFAAVRARYGVERDETLNLRDFPTLRHVVGWIRDKTGTPTGAAGTAPRRPEPPPAVAPARLPPS